MSIPNETDPLALFKQWYEEASACEGIEDHTAMTLATANEAGLPDARMVLLKSYDERGFVFFTNLTSPKAGQLRATPYAALCFYWMPLGKQVRIRGPVEPTTSEEADAYHATRPRDSQVGAWASKQSQPMQGRFELEKRIAKYLAKFGLGHVPRPEFWSGFRVKPEQIEFWLKQPYRLHDRVLYHRTSTGWERQRLFP